MIYIIYIIYISALHYILLLNNIIMFGPTTFYSSIHQLMDIWVISIIWLLWIVLIWTFLYECFNGHIFSFVMCITHKSGISGSYSNILILWGLKPFQNSCTILYFHYQYTRVPISPHYHLVLFCFNFVLSFLHLLLCVYIIWTISHCPSPPTPSFWEEPVLPSCFPISLRKNHKQY
jgi:hypothetical protein